jgi:transposase-like protein
MATAGQWGDNASCPDCGKSGADNSKMPSDAARHFRCTTCQRTFRAAKGTFFATLRTPRPLLLDAGALRVARHSL